MVNAVNAQNLTLPSGTAKIGDTQYTVRTNAMPATIDDLNNIPIKFANGATVFLKDVGQVRDGWAVQQNIVREDGRRAVLLSVIKNGNASTLDVVNGVRKALLNRSRAPRRPGSRSTSCSISRCSSPIRSTSVLREGAIAGGADRADDPAVPRLVAVDADRHDLDSAGDPVVARRAVFPRRHAQHHDARRPGACGRHPGRRLRR